MIEHTSNMPFSSIIRPSNGLGAIACYDSFENKLGVGISPSSIPNAHYLTFRRALLCAPNNIWKSRNYPSFITSSLFSLFTHHSFIHSSLPSFLWEVLIRCRIYFGRGALLRWFFGKWWLWWWLVWLLTANVCNFNLVFFSSIKLTDYQSISYIKFMDW